MCVMAVCDNPEAIFQGLLASGAAADNLASEHQTPDLSTGRTSKDPDVQLLAKMAPLLQKLLDVNPNGRFDRFKMHVAMGLYAWEVVVERDEPDDDQWLRRKTLQVLTALGHCRRLKQEQTLWQSCNKCLSPADLQALQDCLDRIPERHAY